MPSRPTGPCGYPAPMRVDLGDLRPVLDRWMRNAGLSGVSSADVSEQTRWYRLEHQTLARYRDLADAPFERRRREPEHDQGLATLQLFVRSTRVALAAALTNFVVTRLPWPTLTLVDFGAGAGTALLAARALWAAHRSIRYLAVEHDPLRLDFIRRLGAGDPASRVDSCADAGRLAEWLRPGEPVLEARFDVDRETDGALTLGSSAVPGGPWVTLWCHKLHAKARAPRRRLKEAAFRARALTGGRVVAPCPLGAGCPRPEPEFCRAPEPWPQPALVLATTDGADVSAREEVELVPRVGAHRLCRTDRQGRRAFD